MASAFIRLKAEHRFSILLAQDDEIARIDQVRVVHGRICFPGLGSAPWFGQKQPGEVSVMYNPSTPCTFAEREKPVRMPWLRLQGRGMQPYCVF
jgi:hypothetical protein